MWHPYAPRTLADTDADAFQAAQAVASTEGVNLHLADGRTVIDGMSSWWAACHGHGHPHLVEAAHRQIDRMSHVMFGGLTHQPAAELAERLVNWVNSGSVNAGDPMDGVFYSDSGSVAVEVALKMALQYQRGTGNPHRDRFLTWRSGYHGDTQGPMSVCDPDGGMHALWEGTLTRQRFVPAPPVMGATEQQRADYLADLERSLVEAGNIAAVIVEPIVQGAGGMRFHDAELITGLREICDRTGTLLILDEIATGFGRTGHALACHAAGVLPDILCLGKALTGGFMSFAATLTSARVARGIDSPSGGGALMHGPTFMGNPWPARSRALRWTSSSRAIGANPCPASRPGCSDSTTSAAPPTTQPWQTFACSAPSAWWRCANPSTCARPRMRCWIAACGCAPSAACSTPCRRSSARTRTSPPSSTLWHTPWHSSRASPLETACILEAHMRRAH